MRHRARGVVVLGTDVPRMETDVSGILSLLIKPRDSETRRGLPVSEDNDHALEKLR